MDIKKILNTNEIKISEGDNDIYIMVENDDLKYNIIIDKRKRRIFLERVKFKERIGNDKIYDIEKVDETKLNKENFKELKEFIERNFKLVFKYNSWIGRTIGFYKKV